MVWGCACMEALQVVVQRDAPALGASGLERATDEEQEDEEEEEEDDEGGGEPPLWMQTKVAHC